LINSKRLILEPRGRFEIYPRAGLKRIEIFIFQDIEEMIRPIEWLEGKTLFLFESLNHLFGVSIDIRSRV